MCGRFVLVDVDGLGIRFKVMTQAGPVPTRARYNIAPTQGIIAVTAEDGERRLEEMRWGLIPAWAKPEKIPRNTINARDDRLTSSGLWKRPLRRHRCLIPANGFFEWKGPKSARQPLYIHLRDDRLFAFAGLYDTWESPEGETVRSAAIVTTEPNQLMEPIHNRMPAILDEEAEALWLDPKTEDPERLMSLIRPHPSEEMEAYPVSSKVNSPRNDSPELLEPVPE
ncbi:MAG: SOS response-associated peptidase [Chloroflexota bacterium]